MLHWPAVITLDGVACPHATRTPPLTAYLGIQIVPAALPIVTGNTAICTATTGTEQTSLCACSGAQGVLADVSIATGYATIALMIAGRLIFQRAGWAAAAFITPSVLLLFGGAFFAFSLSSAPGAAGWAVLAGAVTQVCACCGALPPTPIIK